MFHWFLSLFRKEMQKDFYVCFNCLVVWYSPPPKKETCKSEPSIRKHVVKLYQKNHSYLYEVHASKRPILQRKKHLIPMNRL